MKDRVPLYPGRVKLVPVSGQENVYDMTRADQPTQQGDPLNKATLLKDTTAALFGLGTDAVPDDVLQVVADFKYIGLLKRVMVSYYTSGVFVAPSDMLNNTAIVVCVGGGGAGAGGTDFSLAGAGGGGGGLTIKELILTPGNRYNVIVGSGGKGKNDPVGEDGGASSFGDSLCVANGGSGGKNGVGGSSPGLGGGGGKRNDGKGGNGGTYGGGGGGGGSGGKGGNGGTYGGGGGGDVGGSGGTYGGNGGSTSANGSNGTVFSMPLALNYPFVFSKDSSLGLAGEDKKGGGGGYGGNGGVGDNGGGGGGGYGGNGGVSQGEYGGGGGGYGGNGGVGDNGGGGGGGFFANGGDAPYSSSTTGGAGQCPGGGGSGAYKASGGNGGDGAVFVFYQKVGSQV